jgi:hypothetical protein
MCHTFYCYLRDYSLNEANGLALIILEHYKATPVRTFEATNLRKFIENYTLILLTF